MNCAVVESSWIIATANEIRPQWNQTSEALTGDRCTILGIKVGIDLEFVSYGLNHIG